MSLSSRQLFVLVVVVGVVGSGVLNYWLTEAGFDTLGSIIWVAGYGGMVGFIWYRWLRPLDLTGYEGSPDETHGAEQGSNTDSDAR